MTVFDERGSQDTYLGDVAMQVIDTEKCTGCRACELGCSYHHTQTFKPSVASIHVQRLEAKGDFDVKLVLYRQAEDGHLACDCSKGNEFCVQYCPMEARDELKALLKLEEVK